MADTRTPQEIELKNTRDMFYCQKNLAYTYQKALQALGLEMEDPNTSPEEKVDKAKEILGYVGANPRIASQDNG
jgi:hypothetical protein